MGWQITPNFWSTEKYQKYFQRKICIYSVSYEVSETMIYLAKSIEHNGMD